LLLQHEYADLHARARWLLEPIDYLGVRLTGRVATNPATMTASWLTDNRVGAEPAYVDSLVRRTKRDRSKLPDLVPVASVLGTLLPAVADALNVPASVPVITGIPDLHAAIVGSGAVRAYDTHLAVSTTAWISARVPFKRTDLAHSIATVPGLDPQMPVVANNHETGGAALRWLREQVIGEGVSYDDLIALAATAPGGCEGMLFTPWLNGERSPVDDKNVRAAFVNVSLRTDRAMMVRSVLEGVAYNAKWLLDPYEKFLRRTVPVIRILGGGAESDLWCQIHADIMERPIEQVANPQHAQLRGVALWARVVLGELTLEQAADLVPMSTRFEPSGLPAYRTGYQTYRTLYKKLAPLA
jgi:xylulokinase